MILRTAAVGALVGAAAFAGAGGQADDEEIAEMSLLRADDFPSAFTEEDFEEAETPGGRDCKTVRAAEKQEKRAGAAGIVLAQESGDAQVSEQVVVFERQRDAKRYLDRYTGTQECLMLSLEEGFGSTATSVDVSDGDFPAEAGDDAVSYSAVITLEDERGTARVYGTFVFVRVGRGVTGFSFLNLDAPYADDVVIVDLGIERLEEALA